MEIHNVVFSGICIIPALGSVFGLGVKYTGKGGKAVGKAAMDAAEKGARKEALKLTEEIAEEAAEELIERGIREAAEEGFSIIRKSDGGDVIKEIVIKHMDDASGTGDDLIRMAERQSDDAARMAERIAEEETDDFAKYFGGGETKYSPINPGPLDINDANTFRSATYTKRVLNEDTTFYRVYSTESNRIGPFTTRTPQNGNMQSQLDLALNPDWGNNATYVEKVTVPKGTTIYEGVAASQSINGGAGNLIGGGNQIFINRKDLDASWFHH